VRFQEGPPQFILIVTPPTPTRTNGARGASDLSPTRAPGERNFRRVRDPSPYPSRSNGSTAEEDSHGDNDTSFEVNGTYNQQPWSQEHGSGAIEANRTSQTPNASLHYLGRGILQLTSLSVQHFLYSYGDVRDSLDTTRRVLDELVTDFVTEICFEASRSAQLAGRQKIKIDDIRFACRKSPMYLGKIQDIQEKKEVIDSARKALDVNDDKITKSNVKAMEEPPLGDDDDDPDLDTQISRGKATSSK
jgi:transcription initiation factor TFIID subunit 13